MRLKIKIYLFGIATRPTEKLAAQIILFAFHAIANNASTQSRLVCIHLNYSTNQKQ
jgi:hypothetical protein